MAFIDTLNQWPESRIRDLFSSVTDDAIEKALSREPCDIADLIALLSPQALPRLEVMAQKAHHITRRQFGRTISLYAPIYLSNVCAANCVYCGFSATTLPEKQNGDRVTLTAEEIERECIALSAMGYASVLLLTGDAPSVVPPTYIAHACSIARRHFASVAVEVYSMEEADYALLCNHGLDGVTLYMETYHQPTYAQMHKAGRKKDYHYRLNAVERAARSGVRRISIGALLGLYDFRIEAVWLALHARYLFKHCWQSALSLSFPRLLNAPPGFQTPRPLSTQDLVQMMVALRLALPEVGFNLSTREEAALRDKLIYLGVTSMSAGSSTRPGGYGDPACASLEQFETEDRRTPAQVADMIDRAGYDPVWKDFDRAFLEDPYPK